ncbi:acyltransferase family protein [Enterococcus asini]|uniref:acyltransferase family protein n=1 Tax=Enterococcus asini TaxID=57732 RepID=UPI00289271E4|nr:acyltransferase family protein [Enterococcus asini]MDT2757533.1 acyltransferase family protein [Enterococcus asini]
MSIISKQSRDLAFDNMRGLLIFLVVFGHALEYFRLSFPPAQFLYVFIYFFHMPVFIFISGYFSKNLQRGREQAVRQFLLPYLLLNLILSIIMLAIGKIDQILILNPGWTLWYLYCMFGWRLLLPDLVKIRHIFIVSLIVGALSGFLTEFGTYMAMARTFGFLPFFLAGYFCTPAHIEKIRHWPYRKLISVGVVLLGLVTAALWVKLDLPAEILWGDRAYALMDLPLWQTLPADLYFYALSFAFIFVFLTLATGKHHFYTSWGQKTLAVYLLHVYLVAPLVEFTEKIANPLIHYALLFIGSLGILWLLSRDIVTKRLTQVLDSITNFVMPPKNN